MHLHHTLEDTAANNAWTEYRPADKALLCGCLLSLALVLPPWPWALCLILVSFAFVCLWAQVPCLLWARALTPALAFGLLGVLPLIWMDGSLERAICVTLRTSAAGSALVLLIVTSPAGELLGAAQRIRTLRPLVEITFLTLRFATILRECAASASIAWHCRAGERRWSRFAYSLQAVASLFTRSLDRARKMDTALALRTSMDDLSFWVPARRASWKLRLTAVVGAGSVASAAFLLRGAFPWR